MTQDKQTNAADGAQNLLQTLTDAIPAAAAQSDSKAFSRLLGMIDDMTSRADRERFIAAFAAAQKDLPAIHKDTAGYGYDYASLPAILASVLPILNARGFALTFETDIERDPAGGAMVKATAIISGNGGRLDSVCRIPYDESVLADSKQGKKTGNSAQRAGAIFTYGRRYALIAALGIAPDDDTDATDAAGSPKRKAPPAAGGNRPAAGNRGGYDNNPPPGKIRIDLKPGYGDNAGAKELGARWDGDARTWYAFGDSVQDIVAKFRDYHPQLSDAQKEQLEAAYAGMGDGYEKQDNPPADGEISAFADMKSDSPEPTPTEKPAADSPFSQLKIAPAAINKMTGMQRNLIRANEAIAIKALTTHGKQPTPELTQAVFVTACLDTETENRISNWAQLDPAALQAAAKKVAK